MSTIAKPIPSALTDTGIPSGRLVTWWVIASEIFIFGGGQIFKEAIDQDVVDRIYLTVVKGDYGADTFFPEYSKFTKIIENEEREADGYQYTFLTLEK